MKVEYKNVIVLLGVIDTVVNEDRKMSAPVKPWERGGFNNQRANTIMSSADQMYSSPTLLNNTGPRTSVVQNPPPIPARNVPQQRPGFNTGFSGFGYPGGGFGSMYTPYGSGMIGGMYPGGFGMNRFGAGAVTGSSFAQQAELSSRPAFQSIESFVRAVAGVSDMLNATYSAVYNSFCAVTGVADHMSHLRSYVVRSFWYIFRTFKWLAYRLLAFLRLRSADLEDELWSEATVDAADRQQAGVSRSSWPIMMFFAIIVCGPWLMWKFLSTLSGSDVNTGWATGTDDHFVAVAQYNFDATNEDELSFQQGNMLNVAPQELQVNTRGWLLASLNGKKVGVIPANYVKVIGKRRGIPDKIPVDQPAAEIDLDQQLNNASSKLVANDLSTNIIQ